MQDTNFLTKKEFFEDKETIIKLLAEQSNFKKLMQQIIDNIIN